MDSDLFNNFTISLGDYMNILYIVVVADPKFLKSVQHSHIWPYSMISVLLTNANWIFIILKKIYFILWLKHIKKNP